MPKSMRWDDLRYKGKRTECIKDDKTLNSPKTKQRTPVSAKDLKRKREQKRVFDAVAAKDRERQDGVIEQFAWKDEDSP